MPKLEDLKAELLSLQTELATIQSEGRVLTDCWIAQAKPGSKKNKYPRLKSRKPIFNGKKTEYLSIHGSALVEAEEAIARGKAVKKLNKRIQTLSELLRQLQQESSKSSKTTLDKKLEWYTPPELIALTRLVLGEIDLDPASDDVAQQRIQATNYYSSIQDGLSQPWFGRVFLHPPAHGKTSKWIKKMLAEYDSGQVVEAVLLVKPSAGSNWFQKLTRMFPVCFPDKRISLLNDQGKPQARAKHDYAIFYLGKDSNRFQQVFAAVGSISCFVEGSCSS